MEFDRTWTAALHILQLPWWSKQKISLTPQESVS